MAQSAKHSCPASGPKESRRRSRLALRSICGSGRPWAGLSLCRAPCLAAPSHYAASPPIITSMTDYMTMTADAPISRSTAIKLYDAAGFEGMRKAGRLAAELLDALVPPVVAGVTTDRKHALLGKGVSDRVDLGGQGVSI